MNEPFGGIVMPDETVEPFEHPTIKEILAQQRIILENLTVLMKVMAQPPMIYVSKESKPETQK